MYSSGWSVLPETFRIEPAEVRCSLRLHQALNNKSAEELLYLISECFRPPQAVLGMACGGTSPSPGLGVLWLRLGVVTESYILHNILMYGV